MLRGGVNVRTEKSPGLPDWRQLFLSKSFIFLFLPLLSLLISQHEDNLEFYHRTLCGKDSSKLISYWYFNPCTMWRQAASSSRHMTHCQLISFCVLTDDLHQEALWYPDSTKKVKSSSSLVEIAAHIDFVLFETSLTSPTSNIFFFWE